MDAYIALATQQIKQQRGERHHQRANQRRGKCIDRKVDAQKVGKIRRY